jgi:NAD(P)-dependent dehydrogenase (short-subunit alcohol dehydrogenase family)
VPTEKFAALADYTTNPLFSDLERSVIRYAEEMTEKVQVDSRLVEELKKQLGPDALVQLTLSIAAANFTKPLQRGARHGTGDLKQRRRWSMSHHAIEGITKSAALEAPASGVRVNAVAPGPIETGMLNRFTGTAEAKAALASGVPLGRVAEPEGIARAVAADIRESFTEQQRRSHV